MTAPALYVAEVGHARHTPPHRAFSHQVYLWLVDLDELPTLPWWLAPFARFRAADHLGRPDRSIRANLDAWLATQGVDLAGGQVLMLAHASVAGYVFNPITLYWCHDPHGTPVCVVAEVHNTYGERHCYLLNPDETDRAAVAKQFYVSPFQDRDGDYLMHVPRPTDRLAITVTLRHAGAGAGRAGRPATREKTGAHSHHDAVSLTATLRGRRRPVTRAELVRLLLRQPLLPQRVAASIRRHGITLWLRRVPVRPRTPHVHQEEVR